MTTTNTYSKSEVGHIKNLENFYDLIQYCKRFGAQYNPTPEDIQIPNLETAYEQFKEKQDQVNLTYANRINTINQRQIEFDKLQKLSTRIINALSVATSDKKLVADARKFTNKIQGRPPRIKTNDNQEGQEIKEPKSNSQRSYDKLKEHFENLILLLETVPQYNPNEEDIKVENLRILLTDLDNIDKQITENAVPYDKALTERDNLLYKETNGIVNLALKVRAYIKSVFGASSLESKEVSKLKFRTIHRR